MVPVPDSDTLITLNIGLSLLTSSAAALFYIVPRLRHASFAKGVEPMLLFHTTRHVGMFFLAPGIVKKELPTGFSLPAAYGDLLAAFLASVGIYALRTKRKWAKAAIWLFNIEGFLDLLYAINRGLALGVAESLGGAMWIPTVIVPALLVTHAMIFWMLMRSDIRTDHARKHT